MLSPDLPRQPGHGLAAGDGVAEVALVPPGLVQRRAQRHHRGQGDRQGVVVVLGEQSRIAL